jgi:hypothetical protein
MHGVRHEQPNAGENQTDNTKAAGDPRQQHNAGDHARGRKHDTDLKRGRSDFVVVIARERGVALMLILLG